MAEAKRKPKRSDGSDGRKPGTFAPGECGNPNGRPRGLSLRTLLAKKLEEARVEGGMTYATAIVEATIRDALKGDGSARKLVWEYIDGKPIQRLEHTGENGGAITFAQLMKDAAK